MEPLSKTTQTVYIDEFQFVSAKKYLSLKGPIHFTTVHDRMFPLIKYGQEVRVEKLEDSYKQGDLLVAWEEEFLYFGLFLGRKEDHILLYFTKEGEIKSFPDTYLFGRVTNIKVPFLERIKLKLKKLFK